MKTVRFAELVAKAGAPEMHQLWIPPAQDPAFQRALKQHRVLTIHQQNVGTKTDYGVVGYHEEPRAQFVVFPKSIRAYEERRVIGINYELLSAPADSPMAPRSTRAKSGRAAKRAAAEPPGTDGSDGNASGSAAASAAPAEWHRPRATQKTAPAKPSRKVVAFAGAGASKEPKVAPESAREEAQAPGAEVPPQREPTPTSADRQPLAPHLVRELTRAMKELKAGKPVAAYERLQALLEP